MYFRFVSTFVSRCVFSGNNEAYHRRCCVVLRYVIMSQVDFGIVCEPFYNAISAGLVFSDAFCRFGKGGGLKTHV